MVKPGESQHTIRATVAAILKEDEEMETDTDEDDATVDYDDDESNDEDIDDSKSVKATLDDVTSNNEEDKEVQHGDSSSSSSNQSPVVVQKEENEVLQYDDGGKDHDHNDEKSKAVTSPPKNARQRTAARKKIINREWTFISNWIIEQYKKLLSLPTYQDIFDFAKRNKFIISVGEIRARINANFTSLSRTSSQPFSNGYSRPMIRSALG